MELSFKRVYVALDIQYAVGYLVLRKVGSEIFQILWFSGLSHGPNNIVGNFFSKFERFLSF